MRVMLVAMVFACSAPPQRASAPAPATPPPERDLAVAEPAPKKPSPPEPELDPNDPIWLVERAPPPIIRVDRRRRPQHDELGIAARDLWSPCLRRFVDAQPEHARRALTAAFSRYHATCDAAGQVIVPPRRGPIRFARAFGELHAWSCTAFESITIAYDGRQWTSGLLVTETEGACTIAHLPNTPTMRALLRDVVNAKYASVRFEHGDVPLTDDVKRDLRVMIDALDALSGP